MIVPVPVAVSVVKPVTAVLPTITLELAPMSTRERLPAVNVPVDDNVALAPLSTTARNPEPTLDVVTVAAVFESEISVVPLVAVALSEPAFVAVMVAPPVPELTDSVPVETLVAAVCDMAPVPSAVIVVVPVTAVLPTTMLPLEPLAVMRFKVPAVKVPAPVSVPPEAESITFSVPVPTLDVWMLAEAVSVTEVVPDVAVAVRDPALVAEIAAPPVPVTNTRDPLPTLVAAVCEMAPVPSAVRVVVPETLVLPITMLPLEPSAVVKLRVPAVIVPAVPSVPPEAESVTLSVPLPRFDV